MPHGVAQLISRTLFGCKNEEARTCGGMPCNLPAGPPRCGLHAIHNLHTLSADVCDGSEGLAPGWVECLLLHDCFADTGVIAKLMCVSKLMRAAIGRQGRGQLMLRFPRQHVAHEELAVQQQRFATWLSRYVSLVRELRIDLTTGTSGLHLCSFQFDHALAAAFLHQGSLGGLQQLRTLALKGCCSSSEAAGSLLLQGLSSSVSTSSLSSSSPGLTQLQCPCYPSHISSIGALTSLRRLQLLCPCQDEVFLTSAAQSASGDQLLAPLSNLICLTQLQLQLPVQPRQLQQLPAAQLLELRLQGSLQRRQGPGSWQEQQALQLGHLTRVTLLQLGAGSPGRPGSSSSSGSSSGSGPSSATGISSSAGSRAAAAAAAAAALTAPDALPPNVIVLDLQRCCGVQLLLDLQQLRQLRIGNVSGAAARQLPQLARIKQLTHLELGHCEYGSSSSDDLAYAAEAWPLLPLKALSVSLLRLGRVGVRMQPAVLLQLSKLQGLTSLELSGADVQSTELEGAAGQLAAALRPLTALQHLQLHGRLLEAAAADAPQPQQQLLLQPRTTDGEAAASGTWLPAAPGSSSSSSARPAAASGEISHEQETGAAEQQQQQQAFQAARHLLQVLSLSRGLSCLDLDLANDTDDPAVRALCGLLQQRLTHVQVRAGSNSNGSASAGNDGSGDAGNAGNGSSGAAVADSGESEDDSSNNKGSSSSSGSRSRGALLAAGGSGSGLGRHTALRYWGFCVRLFA